MKLFLTAWAVLILCVSARAADCFLTLFATDSGWYTPANYHDPDNNNYLVGYHAAGTTEFRDWFVFDLPASIGPIQSVELRLFAFTINSTNAETFELYHVATPVSTLVAGAGPTITRVFTDLGEGTLYASRAVSGSEANNYITIPLNSNAVAAIAAASGQRFALGGKLSSISATPTSDESLFSFSSGAAPNVQLIVSYGGTGLLSILQQPPPLVLLSGGSNASIPVTACGAGTLRYQWFFNNSALTNQTNASLSLVNVDASRVGDYYVVVTNTSGATTSSIARVYVDASAPVLQPGAFPYRTFPIGYTADFYAYANGNPIPHFQWQFNGANIPGATNNYLSIPNVQSFQAGTYTFVASNVFGVVSTNMFLTVEPLIVYIEDFAVESGNDYYHWVYVESSVPVTYQWRFNGMNLPGANGAYLSLFNTSSNEVGIYDVVVANSYGVRTSSVAKLTLLSQPPQTFGAHLITSQLMGTDALVYGDVSGSAPVSVQWYFNGSVVQGATNLQIHLQDISLSHAGGYSFVASNASGMSTSQPVFLNLSVHPPAIMGNGFNGEAFERDDVRLGFDVSGGPRPAVQWQFNGMDIPGATNTSLLLTNLSLEQRGEYTLTATNQLGANAVTMFLNVEHRRALDRWTWRNSQPQANDLKHISFGNGRFVAGGEAGSLVTSTNGVDWNVVSLGRPYLISHVAFGNGLFAAIAEGDFTVLFTSSDGSSWTAHDIPFASPSSLDFANGEFLMASHAENGSYAPIRLAHSADASTWQVTSMLGPSIVPSGIKYGNGTYVAISDYEIHSSKDLLHWARHPVPGVFVRLVFVNGLFIASARYGEIWTSPDGVHWSARNPSLLHSSGSGDVNSVAYGNGIFVAVGDDGVIVRSPNANVWSAVNSTTSQNLRDVVFDGTKFIACGNSGVLLTSPNSVTWTDRRIGKTKDLYGIVYTNDQFVVVGYEGTILTSPDGNTWTTRTSPNSRDLHALTYGGGQYVAVGRRGTVLTSPDAISWTSRATPTTNYLQRIAWGNGRFVVTGEDATILSSTNAINWQQHTASVPANTQMEGVAYGKGVFVIVGGYFTHNAHSVMLVSSNGITWTNVSYDLGVIARGVTFGFNSFLTVGNDGAVIFSGSGLAWSFPSSVAPYQNLRHIKVAAGRAVAVGNEGTILSYNLYNWENHASIVSDNLHDVAYGAGKFVAVGNAGTIVQSDDVVPVFSAPSFSNGTMRFDLRGGMEPEYDVQSSENFLSWSSEGTFTNDGSTVSFTISTNGPLRFFRVRAP